MPLEYGKIIEIAETYGTPLYIYHAEKIIEQYNKLANAFAKRKTRFFYACKALTNINVLKLMHSLGAGLDCVSLNEVKIGLLAGFSPEQIIFTPNCIDFAEVEACKELNVNINIDNISILEQFGNKFGGSYPVCIRINPHIMAGGNFKISTGHVDSKFGISIHQLRHIQRVVKSTGLTVHGLHMHTGSEIKDIDVFIRSLEILLNIAHEFPELKFLDLGSGFKVPYQDGDYTTDLEVLANRIGEAFCQFEKEEQRAFEIWFEPGKFLVSEAGYFVVKANVIKQTTATTFIGVNSGFNHLIRPMFYDSYHKITNISNPDGAERIYTVVGNLCETDTFAWDRKITEVHEGDYLIFHNAGAYGFEMSSNFNSRCRPAEVMVYQDRYYQIRKRDEFEDLLIKQIDCNLFN
ncbi:diaminopimelate decarboxylase [Aquella oligotrophica]|uniref:Diaminopimelate decarboxylase n=1 Tax=Aquella oligotrophica TaxID=2067065 RepID=A0A2I7N679_9NEIS|nr:diaminopimelate decarboxylase [Aquella oligotrophica]AUR51725.1 diaminopimelate decarboxylase [Aquella oligotrophica]